MTAAVVALALLAALAVFQALLVAGRAAGAVRVGRAARGAADRTCGSAAPSRSSLYAVFAVLILQVAGVIAPLPDGFADVAIWVLTGYFALGIVLNAISRSRPERLVMTPVVTGPGRVLPGARARIVTRDQPVELGEQYHALLLVGVGAGDDGRHGCRGAPVRRHVGYPGGM